VILFGATLFLSAFLLFVAQPMVARLLLPQLGGAAAVWTTCLLVFQALLLGGYAYAHGATTALGVRRHVWLHLAVVLLPLLVLPIHLREAAPSSSASPIGWVVLALVTSIGLPFFVQSTSAAVLQKWYASTTDDRAHDPYFLYAASNLGSLTALLAYPTVIEPRLRMQEQTWWWAVAYWAFAALVALCAATAVRRAATNQPSEPTRDEPVEPLTWQRRARWTMLAFIPSSMLLGVTTHISTDIAAVPLLWIAPLGLYLVTFIVAFSPRSEAIAAIAARLRPILVVPLALFLVAQANQPMTLTVPFHLLTFAAVAMVCHGELAADRPPRAHLTELYLWIAVGGALGGLFNALVAPMIFEGVAEYPIILALSCLVVPAALRDSRERSWWISVALGVVVAALAIASALVNNRFGGLQRGLILGGALPAVIAFSQRRHPVNFAVCVAALLVSAVFVQGVFGRSTETLRTFFGVYRVTVDTRFNHRVMFHGTTVHGMQSTLPERRGEPLTYFHRSGPIGQVFAEVPVAASANQVAVAGLGTGSLSAYRRPGQVWTFFELDPAVETIARDPRWFTYLTDCGSQCLVVTGDARLSLGRANPGQFGVIVVDTFSSDAIPVHLLTREAMALYMSRLTPGGILALHVSNNHLSVNRVAARIAEEAGLAALWQSEPPNAGSLISGKLPSDWMVFARRREDFGSLVNDERWVTPVAPRQAPLWTDDFSNVLSVLKR